MCTHCQQVSLFLMWAKKIYDHGATEHNSVWLNLDETALAVHIANRFGNVLRLPYRKYKHFVTRGTLNDRRANCTLAAVVASDPALQPHLPQFLLPNTTGKKRLWASITASAAHTPSVTIMPDTTGWMNTTKLLAIIDRIAAVCREHAPGKHVVMVWDCHAAHIAPAVIRRLRHHNIRPLLVPSKLTPILQVLDFAVFAGFKQEYARAHMETLVASENGQQSYTTWAATTIKTISDQFASMNKRAAFVSAGQNTAHQSYRQAIMQTIGGHWVCTARTLSEEELWFMLGRRQRNLHRLLFRYLRTPAPAPAAVPVPAAPLRRRLRSRTTF